MKYYTGIGSRNTPQFIKTIQSQVSTMLAKKGYIISKDIDKSIKFAICYTNEDVSDTIRIADDLNIPIFDCGKYDDAESLKTSLSLFLKNVLDK